MARVRWHLVASVLLGGVVLGACAGTGYHYVKSSEDRTYFKVPDDWRLYDEDELFDTLFKDATPRQRESRLETAWQTGFDASPKPAIGRHFFVATADHPVGLASVEELDFDQSDQASLVGLRNFFVNIDEQVDAGTGEIITYEPLEPDGGFRGVHLVADVEDAKGRALTFDQTLLLDQGTSKLYTLVVTCNADCYDANEDKIERIVDSWTVED